MYRRWPILLILLFIAIGISAQDLGDHRSAQFATHGTEFWFAMPRWMGQGFSDHHRTICIVAEHDCDVTISNPYKGYSETFHVLSHYTTSSSLYLTNFHDFPLNVSEYFDTLIRDGRPDSQQPCFLPQNYGLHVTSTDTIALYLLNFVFGSEASLNVLPTEMLRDEYVIQSYPAERARQEVPGNIYTGPSFADIVATEDNTIVDIILGGADLMGHHAGDTVTVTLQQGQMYHIQTPQPQEITNQNAMSHAFVPQAIVLNNNICDISGTHIIARDCKRIAVFEGSNRATIPMVGQPLSTDLFVDQSIPIRYAGKEFIVPNLWRSKKEYLRFTGLVDHTTVIITDAARTTGRIRTLNLNAYQTDWFVMDTNEGPFHITTTQPIILKEYTSGSCINVLPTEWWNSNPIHNHTIHWVDNNNNRYHGTYETYILTRTEDVPFMQLDGYDISNLFQSISGTPYSHAFVGHTSSFNSIGTHDIDCPRNDGQKGYFVAWMQTEATAWAYLSHWQQSHIQPGGCYLRVNGIPAQQLPYDSIWCMYDPIHFHAWSERPADSIIWDFGDGTVQRYAYDDGQQVDYTYNTNGDFLMRRIITWRDESTEPCLGGRSAFTRTPDTMSVHINIRNHFDSTIIVRLCEGSYYFRDEEYAYTDTFYKTTYWTPSGCDTLWTIDLVTCPHCHYVNDTVSTADMPHRWGGITFGSEVTDYPIYISINDTCDSIILYTLVVIKHWGEPPLDSTFILVPNIFTPGQETNNRFKIVANKFILEAQVNLFDRRGVKVAEFDGLTGDWDGTHDGIPLPQSSYVYYIRYRDTSVNGWKNLKGTVTLIR